MEYQDSDLRRSLVQAKEIEDFKIITFDNLLEAYEQHLPLYLCVKKNEYLEVHSEKLLSDRSFHWISPEHIRLRPVLKEELIKWKKIKTI